MDDQDARGSPPRARVTSSALRTMSSSFAGKFTLPYHIMARKYGSSAASPA